MKNNNSTPTIVGLLGVAFIILKLCKVIDWSWWWVTLPFWGGFALIIPISILYFWIRKRALNKFVSELPKFEGFESIGNGSGRKGEFKKPKSKFQERLEMMEKQRTSRQNEQ